MQVNHPMTTAGWLLALSALLLGCDVGRSQGTHDRFFDSKGVQIRYRVWGQGPPVVLIHGFGETLERWELAGVVQPLSAHFQVIAMDVRGHGRSGKPHDEASYGAELSGDVVRLLRQLGIAKAHVVGYSMGALIALDVAVRHQEHALSIVLGGAGWIPPETLDDFRQQAEAFEKGRASAGDDADAMALAALLRAQRVPSEADVRSITVPMAALIGANDRFMAHVRRLSRVRPALSVAVIPGATHATAPGDPRFVEALLAFLLEQKNASS